ncbi:hypothetical protein BJX76DRAFT_354123 [Aspergillus varians]
MAAISVGDVITIIEIVNNLAQTYAGALDHYAEISDTVKSLSYVLQKVSVTIPAEELSPDQLAGLSEITQGCKNVLEDLEKELDRYQALGDRGGGFKRSLERIYRRFAWNQKATEQLRARISNHVLFLQSFNSDLINERIARLLQFKADQERQELLLWLSPLNPAAQRSDFMRQYQAETDQWFLKSSAYQKYLEEPGKVLFCPGKLGAGKTILTSLVASELIRRSSSKGDVAVACVYFNTEYSALQTEEGVIATVLKQLVQNRYEIPSKLKLTYQEHNNRGTSMSLEDLWDCLQSAISESRRSFILLDAVDQCSRIYGLQEQILKRSFFLRDTFKTNLFITSREIPSLMKTFSETDTVRIRATEHDLKHYLRQKIKEMPFLNTKSSELIDEIINQITEVADGMFLLAPLHLRSLAEKAQASDIKKALKLLPKGGSALSASYDMAMKRIKDQDQDSQTLARRALTWIVYSKEPLSPAELCWGLGVVIGQTSLDSDSIPDIDAVCNACAGLVVHDQDGDTIRLIHHTMRSYFENNPEATTLDTEQSIVQSCLTFLLNQQFRSGVCRTEQDFAHRLWDNPLYGYAAKHWGHHARRVLPEAENLVLEFLHDGGCVKAASQVIFDSPLRPESFEYNIKRAEGMTGLHLAAYFGLVGPVWSLIHEGQSVNSYDENNNTPLLWAARNGHAELVEKLLKTPQIDKDSKDKECRGPLSWAAKNGHADIVQILLGEKAAADDADKDGHTPLSLAALHGRADVVAALLEAKWVRVTVNSQRRGMRTPLSYAAEKGHLEVVHTLLKYGGDQNIADTKYKRTALSRAAWNGHLDVVQMLIEHGDYSIDHQDVYGWTPLALAVAGGHDGVVKYLLGNTATSPEVETYDNQTPLQIAIARRRVKVVKVLLDHQKIQLGPLNQYGSVVPTESAPSEQETQIIQQLRAKYSQAEVELPDSFHLHPGTNLENLVRCSVGRHAIPNAEIRYHCDVCDNGNFDVCQSCLRGATCCLRESHRLVKQYVADGKVVNVDT